MNKDLIEKMDVISIILTNASFFWKEDEMIKEIEKLPVFNLK